MDIDRYNAEIEAEESEVTRFKDISDALKRVIASQLRELDDPL
jgi:hypothetical protein